MRIEVQYLTITISDALHLASRHTISFYRKKDIRTSIDPIDPEALMKSLFFLLLLAGLARGQDQAATARAAAGCGPDDVQFEVKTDKQHHPVGQPGQGKALVYLFSDTSLDNYPGPFVHMVTRVGRRWCVGGGK